MDRDITIILRGYDPREVDRVLDQAEAAIASGDETVRASARAVLQSVDFTVVLRGYDRIQIDETIGQHLAALGGATIDDAPPAVAAETFTVVLRGYDRDEVDRALAAADRALGSDDAFARAAGRETLRGARFGWSLRGYDRRQVDAAVSRRLH